MRRVSVGPVEAPAEARWHILDTSAVAVPASVLRILAPGSSPDVQHVLRIELSRFIRRNAGQRFATLGDVWNAWAGNSGYVSLFPVRCPDCRGRGFSLRPSPSGAGVCRRCMGRRNITVRQRVVTAR